MLRIASSDNGQTPSRSGSASAISPHAESGAAGNSVGGRSRAPEAARPQGGRATAFGRTPTEAPSLNPATARGLVICAENVRESIADGIATGELRAIGDVLRDQFFYLTRCGFDALQPRAGRYSRTELEAALSSLRDFSAPYQGAADQPDPLFRRTVRGDVA